MSASDQSPRKILPDFDNLSAGQIREQVEKIIRSQIFVHSRRMQRFLGFTIEQTLKGEGDSMKEYSIALAVFDKPDSFDPRLDPIVRVEAGRLRSKLREYYDGPGRLDPVRITYLKRSYIPHFKHRLPEQRETGRASPAAPGSSHSEVAAAKSEHFAGRQGVRAIAVLPFINLSVSQKHEYFSDAMTAEIINVLNRTLRANVVSRTSVLRFKDTDKDIREIAGQLGVDAVLEGSVRLAGKRVRVTAQLANAANGYQIWSQIYDREIKDIFDVQRDLAQAIAQALKVELQKFQPGAAALFGTENSEAYHLYLRGRHFSRRGLRKDLLSAVKIFKKAIAKDPGYALAYVGLADAYATLSWRGAMAPKAAWKNAAEMAHKALQIDGTLGYARIASAHVKAACAWQWEEAEREFLRGLELCPDYADGFRLYGLACLLPQGRLAQARAEINKAFELTPSSATICADFGWILYCQRQYSPALDRLTDSIRLDPLYYRSYLHMGYAYEKLSNLREALSAFTKAAELSQQESSAKGALGRCLGLMGEKAAALEVLNDLSGRTGKTNLDALDIANVYIGLGEIERACRWLKKAFAARCPRIIYLNVDPAYDPIKASPQFLELLKKMGMDYAHG